MSITGVLEHFPFSEFLQTLGNLAKTGTIHLSRFAERGVVILREGRVIGASLSSFHETLGSLLLGQQLVDEDELNQALQRQQGLAKEKRLGAILVEQGLLDRDDLERVIRQQIQRVAHELMLWKHGAFEFEELDIPDYGEIGTAVGDLLLTDGVSAEGLLMASAVDIDEETLEAELESEEGEPRRFASMRDLLLEIRSLEFTGEITTRLMKYAADLVSRSVLFSVQGGHFCGLGCYGAVPSEDETVEAVRALRIPAMEPSILADAAARHRACKGPLKNNAGNRAIIDALGGVEPKEAVAAPLIVDERVAMILYGDAASGDQPIGSVAELEVLMLEAGLVMEKDHAQKVAQGEDPSAIAVAEELPPDEFKRLLDTDPEPLIVVDATGKIRYTNDSCSDLIGHQRSELIATDLTEFLHPNDSGDLKEIVQEIAAGGTPGGKAVRFLQGDGYSEPCYLLPSAVGGESDPCVMLRALTATAGHRRHDPLTGLLGKRELQQRLDRDLSRLVKNSNALFGVLLIGVDQFTIINVTYGWAAGNELLRAIGDRLGDYLRPGDVVGRLTGDQFCVVLRGIRSPRDAKLVADRIVAALHVPFSVRDDRIEIAVSVGVVAGDTGYEDAEELLEDVEEAMKTAKATHGSSIHVRLRANGTGVGESESDDVLDHETLN